MEKEQFQPLEKIKPARQVTSDAACCVQPEDGSSCCNPADVKKDAAVSCCTPNQNTQKSGCC